MKKLIFDENIPLSLFMRAFANHTESTDYSNETTRASDAFWYGKFHENGEFSLGYHYAKAQLVSGYFWGKRFIDIWGSVSSEDGKTVVRYSRTLAQYFRLLLLALFFVISALQVPLAEWEIVDYVFHGILLAAVAIFWYFCFPRYDRKLKKHIETILKEGAYMMETADKNED